MSQSLEHYENLLAEHYSWMFGDYGARVQENIDFFRGCKILPRENGRAIDLGCGSGFQSVALADLGFSVLAMDLSPSLLRELEFRRGNRDINTVRDDLLNFNQYVSQESPQLIVCMGDTLTHLDSIEAVDTLLQLVGSSLQGGGRFVISYRDMSRELVGADRVIPVRSDENKIMTAFLEYFPGYVVVNDFVYTRTGDGWALRKGSYRKLRIEAGWVKDRMAAMGINIEYAAEDKGFSVIIGAKG